MSTSITSNNQVQVCNHCEERFASRNQLFKHLNKCGVLLRKNKSSSNTTTLLDNEEEEDSIILKELSNYAIYVIGGRVRGRTLGSVERYKFSTGHWELCPSLKENRGSHGACAVGRNIYAIGGGGFDSNLATCETLNVFKTEWEFVQPTTIYRHALVLIPFALKKQKDINLISNTEQVNSILEEEDAVTWVVYAIGGWIDGKLGSSDVERYDTVSNTWSRCASMTVARRLMGAAAYKDSIYVFGGNVDDGEWYSAAVERYDPYADTWSRLADLPFRGPTRYIIILHYYLDSILVIYLIIYTDCTNLRISIYLVPWPVEISFIYSLTASVSTASIQ